MQSWRSFRESVAFREGRHDGSCELHKSGRACPVSSTAMAAAGNVDRRKLLHDRNWDAGDEWEVRYGHQAALEVQSIEAESVEANCDDFSLWIRRADSPHSDSLHLSSLHLNSPQSSCPRSNLPYSDGHCSNPTHLD